LQGEPAYRHLIDWENLLHFAADKTLQDIFSAYHADWKNNANYLIKRLGKSFAGKTSLTDTPEGMIRSAFQTLNNVFADTLEYTVNNTVIVAPEEMSYNPELATNGIYKVNKKLLLSDDNRIIDYSGMIVQDSRSSADKLYNELLNSSFNRARVKEVMDPDTPKKEFENICGQKRDAIRSSWKRIHLVVTPLCDVVQKKSINIKLVAGFLIHGDLIKYIDERSEAVFISPKFQIATEVYALVLNLRYFYTIDSPDQLKQEGLTSLFRVRQSLLAEIQSRLARHLSRQGVLFIDDNFS
jgi:RNase H-fold protein (predicted Holliday junction resolvase)